MPALDFLHVTDVLGNERKRFLDSARESIFAPATVLGEDFDRQTWRRASVAWGWALLDEAKAMLLEVLGAMSHELVDLQLTCSGEGDFFKPHYDNNWPETAMRTTTFVYYLGDHATFTCGRLIFPDHAVSVDPLDDSLVVFPAGELHEIEVVRQRLDSKTTGGPLHTERMALLMANAHRNGAPNLAIYEPNSPSEEGPLGFKYGPAQVAGQNVIALHPNSDGTVAGVTDEGEVVQV